jgi:hypothetical protein
MQKLLFVRRTHGVAQKSGNPYDMTEVSNGLSSFTLSNADGIGDSISQLQEGDEFNADVEVSVAYGTLRGIITKINITNSKPKPNE